MNPETESNSRDTPASNEPRNAIQFLGQHARLRRISRRRVREPHGSGSSDDDRAARRRRDYRPGDARSAARGQSRGAGFRQPPARRRKRIRGGHFYDRRRNARAVPGDGNAPSAGADSGGAGRDRNRGARPESDSRDARSWGRTLDSRAGAEYLARSAEHACVADRAQGQARRDTGIRSFQSRADRGARGAGVTIVPVYRWTLPADRAPLRAALNAIAAGAADVAIFTSSNQVTNVIQLAEAEGIGDGGKRGFARRAVGSIGPVCSEQIRAYGLRVDFEPEHSKLGHLVKAAAAQAASILIANRADTHRIEAGTAPNPRRPAISNAPRSPLADHPMLKACRREAAPYTPIWLMRQAGRYMPEYRRVRERHGFLEMCKRPELAAEVTVTAVERLKVDAAIIFADILLPLIPMEVGLHFEKGDGPVIDRPIRTEADLERMPAVDVAALGFVGAAVKLVHRAIGATTPLIGFAGAPFTLASYLIEGGSSRQYQATKTFMYMQPETWHRLMERLARITADYLKMQIEAGAD